MVNEIQVQIYSIWHATAEFLCRDRFTALAGMSRAMMNMGNVLRNIRFKLFGKVAKTATKLNSLVLVETDGVQNLVSSTMLISYPSGLST